MPKIIINDKEIDVEIAPPTTPYEGTKNKPSKMFDKVLNTTSLTLKVA